MGYYTRVLSPSTHVPSIDQLRGVLNANSFKASLSVEPGPDDDWTGLLLAHESGVEIAAIERNPVGPGTIGAEEIDEFLDEIAHCQPASAAQWLTKYLPTVKMIYAFQWLKGAQVDNGGELIGTLMIGIQKTCGGVIQSDGEGFTDDEEADHILWQFSENAKGPWRLAVLRDGKWVRFEMQLGNRKHREAFLCGEVPAGVKILE